MGFLSKILGAVGGIAGSAFPGVGTVAGTAIGSGLGSFGDNIIGDKMSDNNDKKAREWQEKMYDKQFANNKALWYEQQDYLNAYNDPSAQVQRLRKAGINPQLALGAMSVGNAQGGSTGSASVPGASPSSRPSFSDVSASLDNIVNGQNQADLYKEEIKGRQLDNQTKQIDNLTRFTENILRLQDMMAGIGEKKANTSRTWTDNAIAQLMAAPAYQQAIQNLMKTMTETDILTAQSLSAWQELKFLPVRQQMEYEEWVQRLANMVSDGKLTEQQLKTEIERTNDVKYSAFGKKWLNSLNEKTERYVIEQSRLDVDYKKLEYDILSGSKPFILEKQIQSILPDDDRYFNEVKNPYTRRKFKRRMFGTWPLENK